MADPAPASPATASPTHRPFGVVLAGGGARGAAHAGVLRALEHDGLHPAAVVGVSMGAIVGATYALNPDWFRAYVGLDLAEIPGLGPGTAAERTSRLRAVLSSTRSLRHLLLRWGPFTVARPTMEAFLERLTLGRRIEEARVPFAAVATDLTTGLRVVLDRGSAAEAAYASSALAGALPPAERDGALLADGCYADVAPVDVARALGAEVVIVVNPNAGPAAAMPRNGLQAIMRAMEIAVGHHALERFREADLELRVPMALPVVTTDFTHHRRCVAAGVRAVRAHRSELAVLLRPRRDRDAWARRRQPRVTRERDGRRVPV